MCISFEEEDTSFAGGSIIDLQMRDDISFDGNPHYALIRIHLSKNANAIQWLKK